VFDRIKGGRTPVVVTPCMNPGEFSAMKEMFFSAADVRMAMDISDEKAATTYLGVPVVKRTPASVAAADDTWCFLIPLTRFADRIFNQLVSWGCDTGRICRLDEIAVGPFSLNQDGDVCRIQ
jgi:hypothetical protein